MVIIPAAPLLIRVFADRLREDQGRQLGRAVLYASIVGFDVVERRKGDIAAISGVSAARIQEVVDTGRQALNTAAPMVREQHVVSRALLRRFLGPTNQGDRLLSYNLQFGRANLRAPGAVGKLENFVKIDSRETEQLWGLAEQDLPAAIKVARTRRSPWPGTAGIAASTQVGYLLPGTRGPVTADCGPLQGRYRGALAAETDHKHAHLPTSSSSSGVPKPHARLGELASQDPGDSLGLPGSLDGFSGH